MNTGRSDASPWSEHLDHLDHLEDLLGALDATVPTVVAGDFNQRVPRMRQPVRVAQRLAEVLGPWTIHTAGDRWECGPHINHIASNARLDCQSVSDWPGADELGRLSDHAGVSCELVQP